MAGISQQTLTQMVVMGLVERRQSDYRLTARGWAAREKFARLGLLPNADVLVQAPLSNMEATRPKGRTLKA
ncbi:MAG: hypothetical protein K0S00_3400 [Xanthobacteraceae bacterium]|nr:hypothetical protein [Xanthobacteraceae bacterium]